MGKIFKTIFTVIRQLLKKIQCSFLKKHFTKLHTFFPYRFYNLSFTGKCQVSWGSFSSRNRESNLKYIKTFVDVIITSCKLSGMFLEGKKNLKQFSALVSPQPNSKRNSVLICNSALWSQATLVFAVKDLNVSTLLFIQIGTERSW